MAILFLLFISYVSMFFYSVYTIKAENAKIEYNKGLYFAAISSFVVSVGLGTIISSLS